MKDVFHKYFVAPHDSALVNTKVLLLCRGVHVEYAGLKAAFPDIKSRYKTSSAVVAARHRDKPGEYVDWQIDELILSESERRSVVKTYITPEAPLSLTARSGQLELVDRESDEVLPGYVKPVEYDAFSRPDVAWPDKNRFLNRIGIDRIGLLPFTGCEMWLEGRQCHFCGAAPKPLGSTEMPNLLEVRKNCGGDYRAWWGAHSAGVLSNVQKSAAYLKDHPPQPHFHFMYMSGTLSDYDYMYEIGLELSRAFDSLIPLSGIESCFNAMPPTSERYLGLVKSVGYQEMAFNLEFIQKEDFEAFCPGKAAAYAEGYGHMVRSLEAAVEVFGRGMIRTNFVLTSQQISALTKGIPELAAKGVVSDVTIFFPRPASVWREKQSPTVNEVLKFSRFLADNYAEHGFKPYCCALSSRSSILNELCGYAGA